MACPQVYPGIGVVGIELDGTVEGFQGFLIPLEIEKDLPPVEPGIALLVQSEGGIVGRQGILEIPEIMICPSLVMPCLLVFRVKLDGTSVAEDGMLVGAACGLGHAEVLEQHRILAIEIDTMLVGLDGLLVIAQ